MNERIVAILRLVAMLVTSAAAMTGYAVDAEAVYTVGLTVIAAIVAVYSWWKNNNVTLAAQKAQEYLDELKSDNNPLG